MHLPTLWPQRPFPVADRTRGGELYETEHPRLTALRFCREKLADRKAGLDPYDPAIFIVILAGYEQVFGKRMIGLVGGVISSRAGEADTSRCRCYLDDAAIADLGLDRADAPTMDDEPLASRGVDSEPEAILRVLHPERLRLVDDMPEPSQFMPALERARQAAALAVDCGCGAPAGQVCRCSDQARIETAQNERQVH